MSGVTIFSLIPDFGALYLRKKSCKGMSLFS